MQNTVQPGIYSVVIKGTGYEVDGSPAPTSPKLSWVPLNVGGVTRDFELTPAATFVRVDPGAPATYSFTVKTGSSAQAWGTAAPATQVAVTVDRGTCLIGALYPVSGAVPVCAGTVTISPASVTPDRNNPPTVTITVSTTSVPVGTYRLIVRVRGYNQSGQPVVHVLPLTLGVGTTLGLANKYVNVQGYTVFVITSVTPNTVNGRAITGYYANPRDPALNVAHKAGLIPWEAAPCGLGSCP